MMKLKLPVLALVVGCFLAVRPAKAAEAKPERIPWTTSRIHGSPEPAQPFTAARIFPKLEFKDATEIVFDSVSKRWFLLERTGRMVSFPQHGDVAEVDLVVDLKALHPDLDSLYGFAFHPKFAENRQVFITYTMGAGKDDGTKLSRFLMKSGTPSQLDTASEQIILTWRSGGHNGANLQFGPDGMLYVSTGDSEVPSPPDPLNTGQDVSDLLSSILRIDVDKQDAGRAYGIPADNPFLRTPKARPEIWAFGLRNPWKMSFDRVTGRLWCGDVGWELWESIHLIERGGNYGWSAMEASQPVRADAPKPPTPIRPPVVAHSHDEAASITGGYVYHGKKLPELEGAYLYGDWETGKIWALWHDGKQVTRHEEIADTPHKIIAFGQDADGELIYAHYGPQGTLHTLEKNPDAGKANAFPRKLSETGLFKDVAKLEPSPGVYEFDVTEPMWQDSSHSAHWIAIPHRETIQVTGTVSKSKDGGIKVDYKTTWPKDSVLAKILYVESPVVREGKLTVWTERVEMQLLHFTGDAWNAYSYRWNEDGTDAELVSAAGAQRELVIAPDTHDPTKRRPYTWRFQARAECMRCHNSWVGGALAYHPMQLNKEGWFPSIAAKGSHVHSQIDLHRDLGLIDFQFSEQVTSGLTWHKFLDPYNFAATDSRARSYLHANCSHCHRQNAGGAVTMMLNAELVLPQTRTVGVTPQQGGLGLQNPKLIDPGNPWNSVIALRLAKTGTGHMPVIGPHEVDVEGLNLIEDWIARMGDGVASAADLLPKEWSDSLLREKLATVEGAMQVRRAVDEGLLKDALRQVALDIAWKSPVPTVRDLFDRFKPDDQREVTIGMNPDPAKLLAMTGDAKRGAAVLSLQGKLGTCYACHFIGGTGRDFGPDLSKVGARLKREQILESLLHPSKTIAQGYAAVSAEMNNGTVQVGFIVKDGIAEIALKTATGQTVTLRKTDMKSQTKLPASLMPEGLIQGLTAQEAADVVSYLETLR